MEIERIKAIEKMKIDMDEIFKECMEDRRICPVCKKRITDKIWNTQEPLHLRLEHSLGGKFGSWGDDITDVFLCSTECFEKALKKINTFRDWDDFFDGMLK
jgi:hypothetical protein